MYALYYKIVTITLLDITYKFYMYIFIYIILQHIYDWSHHFGGFNSGMHLGVGHPSWQHMSHADDFSN